VDLFSCGAHTVSHRHIQHFTASGGKKNLQLPLDTRCFAVDRFCDLLCFTRCFTLRGRSVRWWCDLAGFVTIVVLGIIALVYKVKAYRMLAESLKISVFNTTASFYKWGAILLVVFGVGFILMFVGDILAIVGFFSKPSEEAA